MAGDRARVSYEPSRKWRGLIAQQGRVTIEADWNEAATIDQERDRLATLDIVGPQGTPDNGYRVETSVDSTLPPLEPGDFLIGPGTLYVGGQRFDLDEPGVRYSDQPDWLDYSSDSLWKDPAVPAPTPSMPSTPSTPSTPASVELVYLVASEQEVCAVEDASLADVALGGPDTMQRQRILQHFVRRSTTQLTGDLAWTDFENSLADHGLSFDPATMMIESTTTLQVSFPQLGATPSLCQPGVTGGYLGAENQMIRVMVVNPVGAIEPGADPSAPVIVWGFDDASFLYRITAATPDNSAGTTTLTLATAPPDSFHFPAKAQAVEVLRSAAQLTSTDYIAAPTGVVSTLTADYDDAQKSLTIEGTLPQDYLPAATPSDATLSDATTPPLYLRVWQAQTTAAAQTTTATAGIATPSGPTPYTAALDGTGVTVTLSSTSKFHPGDFWRFALRPSQPSLVYPDRIRAPQPPDGPRTWACPLALLTWEGGNASASGCILQFDNLVQLTTTPPAGAGGCCTVSVRPSDLNAETTLQTVLDRFINLPSPRTVCLEPGDYTLSAPLKLGPGHGGITLQGCQNGVRLLAPSPPTPDFALGVIHVGSAQGVDAVTIRGIEVVTPLVGFSTPSGPWGPSGAFSDLPVVNQDLMQGFFSGLQISIGVSVENCSDLAIEDCTFDFPDFSGHGNVFGAGIFATGDMEGVEITGCTFTSGNPPTAVPFNELAAPFGNQSEPSPPYQLTFGCLQVPGPSATLQAPGLSGAQPSVLHDATIEHDLFEGVTIPVLVMAQLGTLRVDTNTVRNSYGGCWLVSLADPAQLSMFDLLPVGNQTLYTDFAGVGLAALRDGIFVIATQMGQLLPTMSPDGTLVTPSGIAPPTTQQMSIACNTLAAAFAQAQQIVGKPTGLSSDITQYFSLPPGVPVQASLPAPVSIAPGLGIAPPSGAVPVADTGTGPSLRLEVGECQVDAVIAESYSGAGLLVLDLSTDGGSAVVHANRIRSRFPMGETVLLSGLASAAVTGNIVANEVMLPTNQAGSQQQATNPANISRSLVVSPAAGNTLPTLSGATSPGSAVVVAGNALINPTLFLPSALNTEVDILSPPPTRPQVASISPNVAPAGNAVTVTGSGFTATSIVTFSSASGSVNVSPTQAAANGSWLTVTVPPAPKPGSGTFDVQVTTAHLQSPVARPADQFTYLVVLSVSLQKGGQQAAAGDVVTLNGSGFSEVTAVIFETGFTGVSASVTPGGPSELMTDTALSVIMPPLAAPAGVAIPSPLVVYVTVTTPEFGMLPVTPASPQFNYISG
jgi:Family of unknown function (DUF6519)/IPT/TIG domain